MTEKKYDLITMAKITDANRIILPKKVLEELDARKGETIGLFRNKEGDIVLKSLVISPKE